MIVPLMAVTPLDINGVATGPAVTSFPPIADYQWGMVKVTRNPKYMESMEYHENLKGFRRTVAIKWNSPSLSDAALVLQAFKSKFILATILDSEAGAFLDKKFIVDSRKVGKFKAAHGQWESLDIALIQQDADPV